MYLKRIKNKENVKKRIKNEENVNKTNKNRIKW